LATKGVYAPDTLASESVGRPMPGAYRAPLYPLTLAAIGATRPQTAWRIGLLHLALGLATVGLAYWLGRQLALGGWSAVAAGCVACDPILLAQSVQVMTETLAAALAAACLVAVNLALGAATQTNSAASRRRGLATAGAAGLLTGLAALCRPTFLLWGAGLALASAAAAVKARGRSSQTSPRVPWARLALGYSAGLVLALGPWVARNWRSLESPIATTTHGGYTLYLANNRELYEYLRGRPQVAWNAAAFNAAWDAQRRAALGPGPWPKGAERAADRLAYQLAWEAIVDDPPGFVLATAHRLAWFWGALPQRVDRDEGASHRAIRMATAAFYWVELPVALLGLASVLAGVIGRHRGAPREILPWLPGLWLLVSFTLVHSVYWSNLRMRAPLVPMVAVLAAAGARWFVERKRKSLNAL
jgi:hypothetical protein